MTPRERLARAIERGETTLTIPLEQAVGLIIGAPSATLPDAPTKWVGSGKATELTGMSQPKLSRIGRRNMPLQKGGHHVEIRVMKTSLTANGHWKFAQEDCVRLGKANGVQAAIEHDLIHNSSN